MSTTQDDSQTVQVVYDGACPVCRFYCERVEIDTEHGRLELIDARQTSAVMDEITAHRLDIDEGMVVKHNGELIYGYEAIHRLANLSTGKRRFGRLNRMLFKARWAARFTYPLGKSVRNLLLKMLRISRINNLGTSRSRF